MKKPLNDSVRHALVTGCGGVLGYAVVKRLLADGWCVFGTTRSGYYPLGLQPSKQFTVAALELTNADSIESILGSLKPDVVFHLAACNDTSVPENGPMPIMMANILGTLNLLEAVRKKDCNASVVLTSSIEAAYATRSDALLTPYRCSKLTVEFLAKCYRDSYGISCGVIQLPTLYGPGDKSNRRLIPYCMRKLAKCETIDISSPLDTERDFLYAEDAADALLVALGNANFLAGQLFSVSSGSLVRIGDLVAFLRRIANSDLDSKVAIYTEAGKNHGPPPLTEWAPKSTLEYGLIQTWNWYNNFEINV